MLLPFAILILFMWFFVMRPERKRQKQRAAMLAAVGKGDHVVTAGGIHGVVTRLEEATVTVKVDEGLRLKFDRSAIARITSSKSGGQTDAAPPAEQPELIAAGR